ncbi:MmpS family transport accessory protein [Micromonospora krabiensis]|uniref:Membrane protein n=1 Tax=Micromonospora krabiensis TaxID=307121 RepID=A0A1C3NAS0_9ACTN|nr:MmpS family transport accessory protein [Micromonospora krabiensis]SBV29623.1 membrane protein [Micromonospora krabiensis]
MSEVSPSGDPTPSTGTAPGPWAPPDPGVWSSTPAHAPHTPAASAPPIPPPGWAAQPPAPGPGAYGQPWPHAPVPRRRSGRAGVLIAAATVLVLVVCGAIGAATLIRYAQAPDPGGPVIDQPYAQPPYVDDDEPWAEPPATTPSGAPGTVRVVYEVTGRGLVDLEYYDANGDFVQEAEVPLPWRLNLRVRTADRVMVLAHRYPEEGPVTCRITVDGRTVEEVRGGQWGASCFG